MGNVPVAADWIGGELGLIRKHVPGVRGSVTATSDGLLVAHDVEDLEPTQIAALVAAMHAVAARAASSTQCGQFKEVAVRGSEGYLAVYAAGSTAIVAVLGTAELNLAMLNFQARTMIERIAEHSAQLAKGPLAAAAPAAARNAAPEGAGPLPVRRSRGK